MTAEELVRQHGHALIGNLLVDGYGTRLRVTTIYLPPYGGTQRVAMLGKRLDGGNDIMVYRLEDCKLLSDLVPLDFVIQVGWATKVNR